MFYIEEFLLLFLKWRIVMPVSINYKKERKTVVKLHKSHPSGTFIHSNGFIQFYAFNQRITRGAIKFKATHKF